MVIYVSQFLMDPFYFYLKFKRYIQGVSRRVVTESQTKPFDAFVSSKHEENVLLNLNYLILI